MKSTLILGLLALVLCIVTPVAGADDSQLVTAPPSDESGGGKPGVDAYCEADCIGAPSVSCSASSCSAQDSTCSTPGFVICNGAQINCGHAPTPSVSLSCDDYFRRIHCDANVSGGSGSYSYSWGFQGTASYWSSNGDSAWASWPPSGCYGTNTFDVTVTDSVCGGSDFDSDTTICF